MGDGGGVVVVSVGYMDATRGSGIVSSTSDSPGMTVVRGMRGVGGVCAMCMCFARGGVGGEVVSGREDWVWSLPILWEHGECSTCACVCVAVV